MASFSADRDGRGGSDRRLARPDARPLRLGPGRPARSTRVDWSRTRARSSSPASGIRVPSSPTPWMGNTRSSAITPTTRAVLRSGASPTTGSDHDGILVVVGEHEAMARYYRRWFARVEPVSDFWVERRESPSGGSASTAAFASASPIRSPGKARPGWLAAPPYDPHLRYQAHRVAPVLTQRRNHGRPRLDVTV